MAQHSQAEMFSEDGSHFKNEAAVLTIKPNVVVVV